METAIRKTYTIYNRSENRLIRTFNYLEDAKEVLSYFTDCEILNTDKIMKEFKYHSLFNNI